MRFGDFQDAVEAWGNECLGQSVVNDQKVRAFRFLEEALELAQACCVTFDEVAELAHYTFGRPMGEVHQEIGGVILTLSLLTTAYGYGLDARADEELERVRRPEMIAKIRSKISTGVLPNG